MIGRSSTVLQYYFARGGAGWEVTDGTVSFRCVVDSERGGGSGAVLLSLLLLLLPLRQRRRRAINVTPHPSRVGLFYFFESLFFPIRVSPIKIPFAFVKKNSQNRMDFQKSESGDFFLEVSSF